MVMTCAVSGTSIEDAECGVRSPAVAFVFSVTSVSDVVVDLKVL